MRSRLEGKVAVITGGAGGIGRAGAVTLAGAGAIVCILDINRATGEATVRAIEKKGGEALFLHCDVAKREDVEHALEDVEKQYGRLDILYNNAGVYLPDEDGAITEVEESAWDKILAINLKSVYLLCNLGIPLMTESGGGSIINTASSAGVIGIPNCDAYTATKGAVVQLTKSMAVEYGPSNIRVNCIAPAAIETPMMRQSNPEDSDFDEERFLKLRTPLRRYGTPEEIAQVALFLASDESSYINGAIIVADGGITINGDLRKIS